MIHRYRISRRKLLGIDREPLTSTTVTFIDGLTLDSSYVNSNQYPTALPPTYQSNNQNFPGAVPQTNVSKKIVFEQDQGFKNLVLPIELKFEPVDNSDLIDSWVTDKSEESINEIEDGETVKYKNFDNLKIEFRFADRLGTDRSTWSFLSDYENAGFCTEEGVFDASGNVTAGVNCFSTPDSNGNQVYTGLDLTKNKFKKSFFRLYFYDSNNSETQNLLFTEDIEPTFGARSQLDLLTAEPILPFKRLYWKLNDSFMYNNYNNRVIYMEARFFNAKTGKIHIFNNIPYTYMNPINITDYSQNIEWRTCPINVINPNNSNGEYLFGISSNLVSQNRAKNDGNTIDLNSFKTYGPRIIMSELILT